MVCWILRQSSETWDGSTAWGFWINLSTKYGKKTQKVFQQLSIFKKLSLFSRWENTTSAETEEANSDSPSCACAFWITRKLHHFFSHTAICRPLRLSPLLAPWKFHPTAKTSATCPVTTPSWGKHVSTYPPFVPWNDPLAILLYGLTSNHSFSRPYSCRVPLGDQQFYLPCHSTSAQVDPLLSTSLHQVCYKEANIQQCHRNLLAHKDCAQSNQGPKYNPGRIRLGRFSLGLPVWQPHRRWFAPHVLAQFSSSPLLVRQTIGWPIGDLPVQLAGPHAGQGRKALWRNLCLPHSIFQYISYLSWPRTLRQKPAYSVLTNKKKTSHISLAPASVYRYPFLQKVLEGLGYPKKGWTFEQHQQKSVWRLVSTGGFPYPALLLDKIQHHLRLLKQCNHWKHLPFQVVQDFASNFDHVNRRAAMQVDHCVGVLRWSNLHGFKDLCQKLGKFLGVAV